MKIRYKAITRIMAITPRWSAAMWRAFGSVSSMQGTTYERMLNLWMRDVDFPPRDPCFGDPPR